MSVLVDTPIWSLALRRRRGDLSSPDRRLVEEWTRLIVDNQVMLVGPVRQEVLSGIRDSRSYDRLRRHLRAFDDEPLSVVDYEAAARFCNRCRAAGVAGSGVDFLLCAVASRRGSSIFTSDRDFDRYSELLPVRLHAVH